MRLFLLCVFVIMITIDYNRVALSRSEAILWELELEKSLQTLTYV